MCWFKVVVKGTLGYAGMPHNLPRFRSSIVPAAKVILELEEWLRERDEDRQRSLQRDEERLKVFGG